MNKEMNEEIKMKLEEIKKKINAVTQRGIMYECKGCGSVVTRQVCRGNLQKMLCPLCYSDEIYPVRCYTEALEPMEDTT